MSAKTGSRAAQVSSCAAVSLCAFVLCMLSPLVQARALDAALPPEFVAELMDFPGLTHASKLAASKAQVAKLVDLAIANSPLVREAGLITQSSLQDIQAAKGGRLPQVSVSGLSMVNSPDVSQTTSINGQPTATVTAQLSVYDWGRIDAQVKGRESAANASREFQQQRRIDVAAEAVRSCLDLNRKKALLAVSTDYQKNVDMIFDMLRKIADSDAGRASELVQAKSRLLQAEYARQSALSKVSEADIILSRQLGNDQSLACHGIYALFLDEFNLKEKINQIAQLPSIRQLDEEYQQQMLSVEQISASRKPAIKFSASYGPLSTGLANYGSSLALSFSMPIFDGNTLQSSERSALEKANSVLERKEQAVRQLDYDYKALYEQAIDQKRIASEYTELIQVNELVRKNFFTQWMAVGHRSLFELLSVEAEHYSLRSAYINYLFDSMTGTAAILGKSGQLPGLTSY